MFPITSRYYNVKTAHSRTPDGREVAYLRRRFIPPPERFDLLFEHVVTEGERLDQITFQYLGDPEQFWRIADANVCLRPTELTDTVGRRIRITMPAGIPATPHA